MSARRFAAAALACALAAVPVPGRSLTQFDIDPTQITFAPGALASNVAITNSGTTPAELEVAVAAWNYSDDAQSATPTDDVVASPSIFIIAPGTTQLVRLGLTRPLDDASERAYRLVATEVPDASSTEPVKTIVRMRFPVFIAPRATQAEPIVLRVARSGPSRLDVATINGGNVHRKIRSLRVTQGSRVLYDSTVGAYVLAHQARHWLIPATVGTGATVAVRCDDVDGSVTQAHIRLP